MVLICTQFFLALTVALIILLAGLIFSKKFSTSEMSAYSPFECGLTPKSTARAPFSLQFFVIALVFLIFDMELILIYPALDSSLANSLMATSSLMVFIFLLAMSFFFEWSQTLLEWTK